MLKGGLKRQSSVRVSLLCENTARGSGVIGEHGLSWWIEAGSRRVLFDLGQGIGLLSNANLLGVDLDTVDAIAISHGHYDHVGAWQQLSARAKEAPLFIHEDALSAKFQRRKDGRFVSASDERFLSTCMKESGDVRLVSVPTEVVEGIWMSGEIPRLTDYEDSGGAFFCDEEGKEVDRLLDDQSIFFDTDEGLVVVLGCSHAGVINTLRYLMRVSGRRIHAVVGGMHLLHASADRLQRTVEDLLAIDPDWVGANHCTGSLAQGALMQAFGERYLDCYSGKRICFPLQNSEMTRRLGDGKTL